MKFLRKFNEHASYEAEVNRGGQDFEIPNVSYCKNVDDVHFNPYNLIEFYVGEITEPQTVKIYTDSSNSIDVTVSDGRKWYSYLLPKYKGLFKIEGDSVKKVVVKADINTNANTIIPTSTVEASFKGSNTSNVTNMFVMFEGCNGLTSLTLSSFDTSNVTDMGQMFNGCSGLTSLDLSNFDTSNVTNMTSMFIGCSGLTSLDLSNFKTSKVTTMTSMFYGCKSLASLDLSGWDTSNVINNSSMFHGCGKLREIRMVGCTPETRTKIEGALTSAGIKDNVTIVTE